MQRVRTSRFLRGLVLASLLISGLTAPKFAATAAITLPPKGVSQELWTAYQEIVVSYIDGAERNLKWNASPIFYIAGNPTNNDNSIFRSTLAVIGENCKNITPLISTNEPYYGVVFQYVPEDKFSSFIPTTPVGTKSSYAIYNYQAGKGLSKFTATISPDISQVNRDIDTQLRIYQAMGLRGYTKNLNSKMFSWTFPNEGLVLPSELDKQILRLYCSTYSGTWNTTQQTFDAISTAWTKKIGPPTLALKVRVGEFKNQINFDFEFDPSTALDSQISGIEYRIFDSSGTIVKSELLNISANVFKSYSAYISGIKDNSRYRIEASPINGLGAGNLVKGEGRAGTQPPPGGSIESASDASAEVIDARNAASEAIDAGNEALAQFGRYRSECIEVSAQFETEIQELYDTTSLNRFCEQLDEQVSELDTKIGALDPSKATTSAQANDLTDQANSYAEEADELVALIQDVTDELAATERQLAMVIKLLVPLNSAEIEVLDGWISFVERVLLLPKASQTSIKKTPVYKSALNTYLQVFKVISARDIELENMVSLTEPSKVASIVSRISNLKVNLSQMNSFKKSLVSLNKSIPAKVCTKGSLTLLPSKSGKCPNGYEETSTL